jgi:N-acyl-D-amino-acid deacylase
MAVLNVGVTGGRIAGLSDKPMEGRQVCDCGGLVVAPGFVDPHTHEDMLDDGGAINPEVALCMLRMGVTTIIGGNCGKGQFDEERYRLQIEEHGYPVNIGLLTGHESLRRSAGVLYPEEPASQRELEYMSEALYRSMAAGSFGLSVSPRYVPGLTLNEMEVLSRTVRPFSGIVASHVRGDAADAPDAIDEFLQVGLSTGVRLQISHLGSIAAYGQMDEVIRKIDAAAAGGLDVMCDSYPYAAFATGVGSQSYNGSFLEHYNAKITQVEMTSGPYRGPIPDWETFLKCREETPKGLAVAHVMNPEEVDRAILHPRIMLGSDANLFQGGGHPRCAGAFPRFFRRYVTERPLLSLFDAVEKTTRMAADRFGLPKGRLQPGHDADITVFDPGEICDNATFAEPTLPPSGIRYVFMGGELAVRDGRVLNASLGTFLRKRPGV